LGGGSDKITGPKMGLCDEITIPVTKLQDLKKHKKKLKEEVNFGKTFLMKKSSLTLFLRLTFKNLVLCHFFMLIQGGNEISSQN
jgi:hypothetical protein